ncbi:MAG: UvrD-helicase domain-containing protein, partial [Candidatus Pacearchaeota archaeon]
MALTLTPRQKEILSCEDRIIIINCPPGSGKTAVAASLINKAKDYRYLALTFNKRAAAELQERAGVEKKNIDTTGTKSYCSTFHSFCFDILTEREIIRKEKLPLTYINALLNSLLEKYTNSIPTFEWTNEQITDSTEIETPQQEMLSCYDIATLLEIDPLNFFDKNPYLFPLCNQIPNVRKLFIEFLAQKKINKWNTYADLLKLTKEALEKTPEVFDYIIIDEAQDLDKL